MMSDKDSFENPSEKIIRRICFPRRGMAFSSCCASLTTDLARVLQPGSKPGETSHLFRSRSSNASSIPLLPLPPLRLFFPVVGARRRNSSSDVAITKFSKSKKAQEGDDGDGDGIDEDAFEALFTQLEEDLKNDVNFSDVEDDEMAEDDLARLELELEEALRDEESDGILETLPSNSISLNDSDDEEESRPKLKNWQLRQLARALKIGRRKTSIKNLSAELGLDRAHVLELLREPPPNLLMMCASLRNEVSRKPKPDKEPMEASFDPEISVSNSEQKNEEVPVHVRQTRWSMQKRIKKVHLETLERVYARSKRPTNAMISSIVHVTNLPMKRVVKWFEEKRVEDGIPVKREPFRRATA